MIIDENAEIIKFDDLIFYRINETWWKVSEEKFEEYNTNSRAIRTLVPVIEKEVKFSEIKLSYLRMSKLKRILDDDDKNGN